MGKELRIPIYDRTSGENAFHWILKASEDHRKIRQRQRETELANLQARQRNEDLRDR